MRRRHSRVLIAGLALTAVFASIAVGVAAALATYIALRAGARFLPWRGFFRVSEVMLLLLGAALFTTGIDDLVSAGILPFGAPLWDMSAILDDGSRLGGLIAALTGYRAAPDAVTLGAWALYWGVIAGILRLQARGLRVRTA